VSKTCVQDGETCGYNGNPWCDSNEEKCCCNLGFCSPEQICSPDDATAPCKGEGTITMICSPHQTCVRPTGDPNSSICGAGGKQQIPCCGGSTCQPSEYKTPGGGAIMACVASPTPAPPQQCVGTGQTCGFNGNPWCDNNPEKCCCDEGYCSPEQGNIDGAITMTCSSTHTCVLPTNDPSTSICGAGGQEQLPCCDGATCVQSQYQTPGGGAIMYCTSDPVPTPSPTPAPTQCADWNQQCDLYNPCCATYTCTWANTDPTPSTICL